MDDETAEIARSRLDAINAESWRIISIRDGKNDGDLTSSEVDRLEKLDKEYLELVEGLEMSEKYYYNKLSESQGRKTDTDDAVHNSNNKV